MITISNGPYHVLYHAPDEVRAILLISFSCNLPQPFAKNARSDKLTVEHLIKKPVWSMMDKTEEIVKVFEM
ncbi:hypothetical protein AZE42_14143 [Rhizopogon vesiculosus]|uniref:Uncharacterized protein n=1 Tax=Rhizopogon vesiculosus TaxID=180088 RepID=A0A1J8QAZ5_9AGAM|nr:hypothetical protein AZE42_14143 [Rhizopogon vesiculosus]